MRKAEVVFAGASRCQAFALSMDLRWILLLAALLRIAWVLICSNEPTSDQFIYHDSARSLAAGRGYVDAKGSPAGWYPVGYPAVLAPAYFALGPTLLSAAIVNLVLGLATVAGVFQLARTLFGDAAARVAGLLTAAYPTLVLYTTVVASENAYFAGTAWSVWLMAQWARATSRRGWWLMAAGAAVGLLAYVRAPALLLLIGVPVLGWTRGRRWPDALGSTALAAAVAVALLIPWGMRNQRALGRFALVSLNGGCNLWMGNHEGSTGGYSPLPVNTQTMNLAERDQYLAREAMRFIMGNPGKYLVLCVKRLWMSLRSDTIAAVWNITCIERRFGGRALVAFKLLCSAGHYALWAGLLLGLVRRVRRRTWVREDVSLSLLAAASAVPMVLIVGGNRYQLPLIPVLSVWVAGLLWGSRAKNTGPSAEKPAGLP